MRATLAGLPETRIDDLDDTLSHPFLPSGLKEIVGTFVDSSGVENLQKRQDQLICRHLLI